MTELIIYLKGGGQRHVDVRNVSHVQLAVDDSAIHVTLRNCEELVTEQPISFARSYES